MSADDNVSASASASSASASSAAKPEAERGRGDVPQTLGLRIARGLLAPVLVLGAVGVHFAVNVPADEVLASNRDQGAKKKKDKKTGRRKGRPRAPVRPDKELNAAWERWSVEPFEGEPIKGKWGRRQNAVVNKAVSVAREEAFRGAPERPRVVASGTQCRTIRCRVYLRSPFEHELTAVADALARAEYDGERLWRDIKTQSVDPPTPQSPRDDHYLEVILGVAVDGAEAREIVVPPSGDDKTPAKKVPAEGDETPEQDATKEGAAAKRPTSEAVGKRPTGPQKPAQPE